MLQDRGYCGCLPGSQSIAYPEARGSDHCGESVMAKSIQHDHSILAIWLHVCLYAMAVIGRPAWIGSGVSDDYFLHTGTILLHF